MSSNEGFIDGKITRAHREYRGRKTDRYPNGHPIFPWKDIHEGRVVLCLVYKCARLYGSDDQLKNKKPSELKIRGKFLMQWVVDRRPDILEIYERRMGVPLKPGILMYRLSNMLRFNEGKTFGWGPEHPKNHPVLYRYLCAMDAIEPAWGFDIAAFRNLTESDIP